MAALGGCGGSDDPPDLEASQSTTQAPVLPSPEPSDVDAQTTAPGSSAPTPVPARERDEIVVHARSTAAALGRWQRDLDACMGASGKRADIAATCTSSAWEQLFDQMYLAQNGLLDLIDRMPAGGCHDALASVLDAVHGFLGGATPLEVVWLDEQQQPPSRFDLESIVDLARPVPARLRDAAATTCSS